LIKPAAAILLRVSGGKMFCPTCGVETAQGLRFCKQCGANLNAPSPVEPPRRLHPVVIMSFLAIIGLITIIGITVPLAASTDLKNSGFSPRDIMALFSIGMVGTLALDAMLVWLLLRLIRIYQHPHTPAQIREVRRQAAKEELRAQLDAPPSVVGSVTEHTTRNFDQYGVAARARQAGRNTNEV
jgi:hypothetical protein